MNRQSHVIQRRRGFTLIELMAVVLIICILAGIVFAIATNVTRSAEVARAKAQLAALSAALEAYKADVGYYPVSTIERFSGNGYAELTNSWYLYRALTNRPYYTARQMDLSSLGGLTYFKDPWGAPWNYYRPVPPQPAALTANSTTVCVYGGQMNPASYDLFSFGPDGSTYILSSLPSPWRGNGDFQVPSRSLDDITNWKQ